MTLESMKTQCSSLRSSDRDFYQILETLIFMDDSFNQQSNEKMMMRKEYSSKIEGNKFQIGALRKQIDEQRILLLEKKMELVEITTEFEETQDSTHEGGNEHKQLESELVMH